MFATKSDKSKDRSYSISLEKISWGLRSRAAITEKSKNLLDRGWHATGTIIQGIRRSGQTPIRTTGEKRWFKPPARNGKACFAVFSSRGTARGGEVPYDYENDIETIDRCVAWRCDAHCGRRLCRRAPQYTRKGYSDRRCGRRWCGCANRFCCGPSGSRRGYWWYWRCSGRLRYRQPSTK